MYIYNFIINCICIYIHTYITQLQKGYTTWGKYRVGKQVRSTGPSKGWPKPNPWAFSHRLDVHPNT